MKKILNVLLTLGFALPIISCSSGSSSSGNSGSNISSIVVEVANQKIIKVTLLAESGTNQNKPLSVQYPHGKNYYLGIDQATHPVTKYYFPSLTAYRQAKAELDSSYSLVMNKKSKQNSSKDTTLAYENGYDIGVIPSTSTNILGSGDLDANGNPVCYNYIAQIQGSGDSAFSSVTNSQYTNQSSTDSSSLGVSANIKASYGLYSGSASVSYDSSWQGSQASSSFSFFSYVAGNVSLSVQSISEDGLDLLALNSSQFISDCGNAVVTSIPMGYSVFINTNDSSSSSSQNSSVSASLSASYGTLDSFNASVNTSSSSSSSSDNISITVMPEGDYVFPAGWTETIGGISYTSTSENLLSANDILDDWENANPNPCNGSSSQSACSTYMTNLSTVQSQITTDVEDSLVENGLPQNLGLLAYYPNGVQLSSGGDANTMQTTNVFSIPAIEEQLNQLSIAITSEMSGNDAWATYQTQLENYITLMYQINQLYLRSDAYYQIIAGTYSGYPSPSNLDYNQQLSGTLNNLSNSYLGDLTPLKNIVGNCLNNVNDCASMPNLSGYTNAYNYYGNQSLYTQVAAFGGQTANTQYLKDKQNNAVFLQYQTTYTENASLVNPAISVPADSSYNGPANPTVNNTVPMGLIYVSSQNLASSAISEGLLGFAMSGITMSNPYWPYTGNGQSSIGDSPFITSQYTYTPPVQFMYNLPISSVSSFFNTSFSTSTYLIPTFDNLPVKIVNGNITEHDAPVSVASYTYPDTTWLPTNSFELSTADINNNTLPSFGFVEIGAFPYNYTTYPVAGVFGPAGAGVYSHQYNNLLTTTSNGTNNMSVPSIEYNYTMTIGSWDTGCNQGDITLDCVSGYYPFGDIVYPGGYTAINPLIVSISSTKNTYSLAPIASFFPSGFSQ